MGCYNVAFRCIDEDSGYFGVITWTSYPSEKDYEESQRRLAKKTHEVLEAGISEDRCIELAMSTPWECRLNAARHEAEGPDGEFDEQIYKMKLATAIMAFLAH